MKLTNFENLYNKLIYETAEFDTNFVHEINNCDEFFKKYIQPLTQKINVLAEKQKYNTFRIFGLFKDIKKFLNTFTVDKEFCTDINNNKFEFKFYSPMICLGNIVHIYNNGNNTCIFDRTQSEGNALIDAAQKIQTTRSLDDLTQKKLEGRWFNLYQNTEKNPEVPDYFIPKEVHAYVPAELTDIIKNFLDSHEIQDIEELPLYVEFMVNCDKLPNNCYGEIATQVPVTFNGDKKTVKDVADKMNDPNKMTEPTAVTAMPKSDETSLVNDNQKILKKVKKHNYNKLNKVK